MYMHLFRDRIWLWRYYTKIPMYSILYLFKEDDIHLHVYLHVKITNYIRDVSILGSF